MRALKVIIPAACFQADQLDAATFVFKTLRVGFPTAEVVLVIGNTASELRAAIIESAKKCGVDFTGNDNFATHSQFDIYEHFLQTEQQPFFFCDTDIIFWKSIEAHVREFSRAAMAGRFIPKFYDNFTRCITMTRVHNCLLYVDPHRARRQIEEYYAFLGPLDQYARRPDLIRALFVPIQEIENGFPVRKNYFYDTWAMAYHALPDVMKFSDEVDACFDHLNCGSVAHRIGPAYGVDFVEYHRSLMRDPDSIRGLWQEQRRNYESRLSEIQPSRA